MKKYATLVLLVMFVCCFLGTTPVKAEVESIEMYRLYNPYSGEHFYTSDTNEKNHLTSIGWNYEGIGWIAPKLSSIPVYRLYNPNSGDHHYTLDENEKNYLASIGWNYEGIGWYSDEDQGVPLYRQYNPNEKTGTHNYTTSKEENDFLISIGWRAEGIGWYGLKDIQDEPIEVPHIHDWVAEYETVHHEEKGHEEQYAIKEAWTESIPIYNNVPVMICNDCGAELNASNCWDHIENHALNGGKGSWTDTYKSVQVGANTINHPAEYGTRYVIDEEAYDELVLIGYTCSCGATK